MKKTLLALLASALLWPVAASALEFGVRGNYWMTSLDGEMKVTSGALTGTTVDMKDDLDLEDENLPGFEAFVGMGKHHLSVAYMASSTDGSATLNRQLVFDGNTYNVGEVVKSDLSLTTIDAVYQYDLFDFENVLAGFSLGPVVQVKFIDGEAKIRSATTGTSAGQDFTGAVPMVGVGAHLGILANILEARGRVTAIGYSGNSLVDGFVEAVVTPFPFLDIGLGYRALKLDADISDVLVDVGFTGPYMTVSLGW